MKYKVGDVVRIKTWSKLEKEFKICIKNVCILIGKQYYMKAVDDMLPKDRKVKLCFVSTNGNITNNFPFIIREEIIEEDE